MKMKEMVGFLGCFDMRGKFNDFIEDPSILDCVRDNIWVHDESSPHDLVNRDTSE